MSDQLGLFDAGEDETGELDLGELRAALTEKAAAPAPAGRGETPPRRRSSAPSAATRRRRRVRRIRHSVLAVLVLAVIAGGVVVGFRVWRTDTTVIPDFAGTGEAQTVVRVQSGDTLTDIADTLAEDKVVASAESFVDAAAGNDDVKRIKTGYYRVRLHASAAAAVAAITDPAARVGQLRLIPGRQLADIPSRTGGAVTDGYITAITAAACVPLNGVRRCFTADQLWQAEETADPGELGVVSWAVSEVEKAPDHRKRLEGMLVPGDYDVPPGSTPVEALQAVVRASAANWNATDVVADARSIAEPPYRVAIVASLVEREGNSTNLSKVARVVYNRLALNMKLQLDSTVDYSLSRSDIATTAAERANPSPYNTYAVAGLPPTPITSPSTASLDAALAPDEGNWLFFVQVDKQGNFCFSATFAEHSKCVAQARANGVFGE